MAREISIKKREIAYLKYDGHCSYCGCKIDYKEMHVDHLIPRFRGSSDDQLKRQSIVRGTNDIDNLMPSCASCNLSKSTFTLENWRIELTLKLDRLRKTNTNFRILERYGVIQELDNSITFHFEKKGNNGRR